MKKFLVLALMILSFSFASAEVPKALEDDTGIELVTFDNLVSPDAVAIKQSIVLEQGISFEHCISNTATLEKINRIDRTFFVPTYSGADMFRRSCYKLNYIKNIEKPPLKKLPVYLSSFRSVYNWSSLRA
jgi:hypothetical protein